MGGYLNIFSVFKLANVLLEHILLFIVVTVPISRGKTIIWIIHFRFVIFDTLIGTVECLESRASIHNIKIY